MTAIMESIVRDLKELPSPKLVEVSSFIHSLLPSSEELQRRQAAIIATAGCMPGAEGEDFERSVRETADLLDEHE